VADFTKAIERVLSHEGGDVDDPLDPGGLTRFGISQRAYPSENIKALTRDRAIALYRRDYWNKIRGDELPDVIGFQVLDAAVNHGTSRAIQWLQRAAGAESDGVMGPKTLLAVKRTSAIDLLARFNSVRLDFYADLHTWARFGRGWAKRVADNLAYGAQDAAHEAVA
jgi:lysozyme family protein